MNIMLRKKSSTSSITFKTLIGEGTVLEGDIKCNGALRIDGTVNGNINSENDIFLGENAHVKGNLYRDSIYVSGKVEGNIYSKSSIHLFSTANIQGDIEAFSIVTDEGAIFNGKCSILTSDKEKFNGKKLQKNNIQNKANV